LRTRQGRELDQDWSRADVSRDHRGALPLGYRGIGSQSGDVDHHRVSDEAVGNLERKRHPAGQRSAGVGRGPAPRADRHAIGTDFDFELIDGKPFIEARLDQDDEARLLCTTPAGRKPEERAQEQPKHRSEKPTVRGA
jgi:hypothetical protein